MFKTLFVVCRAIVGVPIVVAVNFFACTFSKILLKMHSKVVSLRAHGRLHTMRNSIAVACDDNDDDDHDNVERGACQLCFHFALKCNGIQRNNTIGHLDFGFSGYFYGSSRSVRRVRDERAYVCGSK